MMSDWVLLKKIRVIWGGEGITRQDWMSLAMGVKPVPAAKRCSWQRLGRMLAESKLPV